MSQSWSVPEASEADIARLAERLALKLAPGDSIALIGDLGAGKTTFARALIRAVLEDPGAEVPSPTFSIIQTYESPRLELAHLDLYRISDEDETRELGVEDQIRRGVLVIEWSERAPSLLTGNRLEVVLGSASAPDLRSVTLRAMGTWAPRLARIRDMSAFLDASPTWAFAEARYLQGDASARAYARLAAGPARAVLMDQPRQPDGPPIRNGLPYSRLAHLAEDVRPFVAVAEALRAAGLSAPEIYASDLDRGFLILEDFGERTYGREIAHGTSQAELWRAATDALVLLAQAPVPGEMKLADGALHHVPPQDRAVLEIEVELLPDWYWPHLKAGPVPPDARQEFLALWSGVIDRVLGVADRGWVLRDYHSPNLMWLPDREGALRAGLLDFQDALEGPLAYDLVSLLQDARIDVPAALEVELLDYYCRARAGDPAFKSNEFRFAYSALGAQRNTKILGIFARLAKRDQKPHYLAHIPRIWRYLARCLAHPELAPLRAWYDRHLPEDTRERSPRT